MKKSLLILSLLMLTLSIIHVPCRGEEVLNIACGAIASFTDAYGNEWVGDDQFIGSGSTARVQLTSPDAPFLSTVRYFPYGSMNCYRIPGVTRGAAIRVDAIFQYGNYDSRALPPSFLLQIDGSNWADVETSAELVRYWTTYLAVANSVSVCLAPKTLGYVPFISAIRIFEDEPGSSTRDDNSAERVKFSKPTKVRAKGKLGALIYLVTLFPSGTFVLVAIIIFVIYKENKKKQQKKNNAEADVQLGAGIQLGLSVGPGRRWADPVGPGLGPGKTRPARPDSCPPLPGSPSSASSCPPNMEEQASPSSRYRRSSAASSAPPFPTALALEHLDVRSRTLKNLGPCQTGRAGPDFWWTRPDVEKQQDLDDHADESSDSIDDMAELEWLSKSVVDSFSFDNGNRNSSEQPPPRLPRKYDPAAPSSCR
ncbi:hypothetical protein EJ110_NYTH42488 [Nymphaea thermarum]|nr:hypothetical protein EJ110_NYTH42488 [Nymphaea thermarum]